MRTLRYLPLCTGLALASVCMFQMGCESPPKGEGSGRVETTDTTHSEIRQKQILAVALVEFSDQAAQQLTRDLADMRTVRDLPPEQRATVILGDINNQTEIVSSTDFEAMRARLRNNLLNSTIATDRLKFVENRARLNQLRQREMVLPAEGPVEPEPYDPQSTYALNGDFYRIARGSTNQYYMEFQLVHFGSNEIVFSRRYEVKQSPREQYE